MTARSSTTWLALLFFGLGTFLPAHSEGSKRKKTPALEVETERDILSLNAEMAQFLVERIGYKQVRFARLQALLDAIFGKKGLDISYGNTRTKTAIETFETQSGNCLSFTLLFVAMARHLGLDAYFQEVTEVMSWDQKGELVISSKHIFAEVEIDNGVTRVDFLRGEQKHYRKVRRISDRRALAHFFNNIGAEQLTDGTAELAIEFFEKAVAADDSFIPALINLGVAQRRVNSFDLAEQSFLHALEVDNTEFAAASNLASLYLARGRKDDAAPLLLKAKEYLEQNPFHLYRLGLQTAEDGKPHEAIRQVKEAIRRLPKDSEFHVTLANLYLEIDDTDKAVETLQKAVKLAKDKSRRAELSQRLESLGVGI